MSQTKVPCIEEGALSEMRIVTYHDGIVDIQTLTPLVLFIRFQPRTLA